MSLYDSECECSVYDDSQLLLVLLLLLLVIGLDRHTNARHVT